MLEDASGKTKEKGGGRRRARPNEEDRSRTRGEEQGTLSPHPLQGKMLLVTLWGQAITHKL